MKSTTVTIARVYLTEQDGLKELLAFLHDESQVRGVTVFRGVSGFGRSGITHSAMLLDTVLDLPVVVEFFDTPERTMPILEYVNKLVKPGHLVSWQAQVNEES